MKIKCDYCGNFIKDSDEICEYCGAVNSHMVRHANGTPTTIEKLKQWCIDKNIPLQKARYFIGEDYRGARAFGIYQDEYGKFIVYKNKSDGSSNYHIRTSMIMTVIIAIKEIMTAGTVIGIRMIAGIQDTLIGTVIGDRI